MIARWKRAAAVALALSVLAGRSAADETKAQPSPEELAKAFAEAAKVGPEHAKLKPLAGTWTYACKLWFEPGKPPVELTGTATRKWILGGRFLEERVKGAGFDGKPGGFEGVGLIGYDNSLKNYVSTWACNADTGTTSGVGVAESSGKFTFQTTCTCPLLKKTIQGRDEIRIESVDKVVLESYKTVDGKETKVMEITFNREKK